MNDIPDDDQYDTEDSFIDDAELVRLHISCLYNMSTLNFVLLQLLAPYTVMFSCLYSGPLLCLQDEYFEVDNSAIKHDGFFVNRGKLERL